LAPSRKKTGEAPSVSRAVADIDRVLAVYRKRAAGRVESVGEGQAEDWRILGPALLARAAYALETIRILAARDVDVAVITRTLYETVLTFTWIAIDPSKHAFRWLRTDRDERLTAMRELQGFGVYVDPDTIRRYEMDVSMAPKPMPSVYDMAREADAHWMRALHEFSTGSSKYEFRGLYTALYRAASGAVHPRQSWLGSFVHNAGPTSLRVGDPIPAQKLAMLRQAPFCFASGLLVSAVRLGWPPAAEVIAAFDEVNDEQ
jgi:hypothetical protein